VLPPGVMPPTQEPQQQGPGSGMYL
jgi:hypothetical protein